jgi:hypothetical protein
LCWHSDALYQLFLNNRHCRLRKESVNSEGQAYHLSQQKNVFARPEPVPGFPTLHVLVFIVVSDFEVRGVFVDIDGIFDHHDLQTFFL